MKNGFCSQRILPHAVLLYPLELHTSPGCPDSGLIGGGENVVCAALTPSLWGTAVEQPCPVAALRK